MQDRLPECSEKIHHGRYTMTPDFSSELFALVSKAESIAITTHISSDGDGMVAAIALQELLRHQGGDSFIVTDGEDLARYSFLSENIKSVRFHSEMLFDLVIVLDCNSYDRLGERGKLVQDAKHRVVIDHHVVEHAPIAADLEAIDSHFVSVGALLFHLFEEQIRALDPQAIKFIADCVYVTILNDTNNFGNANTTADVFELCRDLVNCGALPHLLNMAFLKNQSAQELQYVGQSLANIRLLEDGKILFLHSDLDMAHRLGFDPEQSMSVTRYVQGVPGLTAIAYFRELKPELWKVSLRSLKLDVQSLAADFGGGGHRKASGLTIKGSLADVQAEIHQALRKAIDRS